MNYDLAVAWISKTDAFFVELLDTTCRAQGLSLLQITPVNLEDVTRNLKAGVIFFRAFMDRSSDEDERFLPLVKWARENGVLRINSHEKALRARDKARMHLELFRDLFTPYTIILPSFKEEPELGPLDLSPLGATFTTKPAFGGGGEGVIVLCTTLEDIQTARRQFPEEKYLLQARIVPTVLGGRRAWFRIIYNTGKIYPFWWDTETHVYTPVTVAERYRYHLEPLEESTVKLAKISGLDLFSTEIAMTPERGFHVVDYVNDPLDLTPRSQMRECVPDEILGFIAEDLVTWLAPKLVRKSRRTRRSPGQLDPRPKATPGKSPVKR
jgi:hypothetical protein